MTAHNNVKLFWFVIVPDVIGVTFGLDYSVGVVASRIQIKQMDRVFCP